MMSEDDLILLRLLAVYMRLVEGSSVVLAPTGIA